MRVQFRQRFAKYMREVSPHPLPYLYLKTITSHAQYRKLNKQTLIFHMSQLPGSYVSHCDFQLFPMYGVIRTRELGIDFQGGVGLDNDDTYVMPYVELTLSMHAFVRN